MTTMKRIVIPATAEHAGIHTMAINVEWVCIFCGQERGEPYIVKSYDGSRYMNVHGWRNPCGHTELYSEVRHDYLDKNRG